MIDGKREDNNVYFLNGVTESDLMALAEKNNGSMSMIPQEESCSCTEKCEAGKVNTGCPVCKNDLNGCKGKEKPTETEKPAEPEKPKKETGSVGTILFILVALLAVGGIGYYVKSCVRNSRPRTMRNLRMTVMAKALTRMRHTGNRNIFPRTILTTRTANKAVLLDFMKVRIFSWNIS